MTPGRGARAAYRDRAPVSGRPALAAASGIRLSLGIDVGGTKIAAGLLSGTGNMRPIGAVPTIAGDGDANLAAIREFAAAAPAGVTRVGVSLATTLDGDGIVRDPQDRLGWRGLKLAAALANGNHSAAVIPDAEAGAIAENLFGAGRGRLNMLYVTLGTGLSHCMIADGVPVSGAHGAGYMSGFSLPARCDRARCNSSSVEEICSGQALARSYGRDASSGGARAVISRADAGDPVATTVVRHAAWHFGAYLADLVHIFDPEVVIIGGGLGAGAASYRQSAVAVARSLIRPAYSAEVPIVPAELGDSSAWVGAAYVAAAKPGTSA